MAIRKNTHRDLQKQRVAYNAIKLNPKMNLSKEIGPINKLSF